VKTMEARKYEMLLRVRDFGRTYGNRFPESSYAAKLFGDIDSVIKQLGDHTVSRMSAARDGSAVRTASREALLEQLEAMNRTAQAIGTEITGLEDKFVLPASDDDPALLAAGRLFAQDAVAYEKEFIGHGMASTFLVDLGTLVAGLDQAIVANDVGRDAHVAARAAIEAAITVGVNTMRKIDTLVRNVLRDDPAVMAVWERDRRVQYPPAKRAPAATTEPSQSATPAVPEPAAPAAATPEPAAPAAVLAKAS